MSNLSSSCSTIITSPLVVGNVSSNDAGLALTANGVKDTEGVNLGYGDGLFRGAEQVGSNNVLEFKSILAGPGITSLNSNSAPMHRRPAIPTVTPNEKSRLKPRRLF